MAIFLTFLPVVLFWIFWYLLHLDQKHYASKIYKLTAIFAVSAFLFGLLACRSYGMGIALALLWGYVGFGIGWFKYERR